MSRVSSLILLIFLACQATPAQNSKEFQKSFYDGNFQLYYDRYDLALPLFLELAQSYPDNANLNYLTGKCFANLPGNHLLAIPYLKKAILRTTKKYKSDTHRERRAPNDAHYLLGTCFLASEEIEKALTQFEAYRDLVISETEIKKAEHQIASCYRAQNALSNRVDFEKIVADVINPGKLNYNPCLSGDGKSIVFMSDKRYYRAIYHSRWEVSSWSDPVNITAQIESDGDFIAVSLSHDGKILLLSHREEDNTDIYISRFNRGRWSHVVPLNNVINSKSNETHAFLSRDGNRLLFSSDRRGSMGGLDLFSARRDNNGNWSEVQPMNATINTPYNETAPYLAENDNILFFSSQGHSTIGGYDIFRSVKKNNNWSTPENLGFPFNTTADDLSFAPLGISSQFLTSLYTDPESRNIFRYEVYGPENPRPRKIMGKIDLKGENKGILEKITLSLEDHSGKLDPWFIRPNTETGEFTLALKPGRYNISINGEGIVGHEETLAVEAGSESLELTLPIELKVQGAVVTQKWFEVRTLFFEFDKHRMLESYHENMDSLIDLMEKHKNLTLKLHGHTDEIGASDYNFRLSKRRAESVKSYLTRKGIPAERISIIPHGEDLPVALNRKSNGNDNPAGRHFNRRVQIELVGSNGLFVKPEELIIPDPLLKKQGNL